MRPLLVLILVVAAVGALLFALSTMDSDRQTPAVAPETASHATPADAGGPATPLDRVRDDNKNERISAPVDAANGRTSGGPTPFTFDNNFTGKVQNLMGQAVAGAEVTLTTVGADSMFFVNDPVDRSKDQKARTDAEGAYRFRGVEPRDRYTIIVEHPNYARYEGGTVPITDFGAHEEPPIVLKPGATLSGYVRDESGGTIPDAALFLENFAYQGLDEASPDRMQVSTNKEGFYSFNNVPRGQRILTITAKGFGTITIPGLNFDKEETQTRDVTLKVSEMLCGRVVAGGDEGVPNARVLAIGVSSQQQSARGEVRTNEKGEFCFENLVPGDYNLIATTDGYRMTQGPKRVATNTSNHVIEMLREAGVLGRCVDAKTGDPIPNFTCRLRFWYGTQQPSQLANEKTYPQANANGEFSIPGVPQGDYVVEAMAPGFAPGFSNNFTVVAGKDVGNVTVGLTKGGSLSGRVVDGEGKPVARARVTTHDNEWTDDEFTRMLGFSYPTNATSSEGRTDDQGRFTIHNLTPESYQVNIRAAGFTLFVKKDVRVAADGVSDMGEVKLSRGGSVRGTFFDASGKPLQGGMISLQQAEGAEFIGSYSTKSGQDGRFTFANVAPGRFYLRGTRAGGPEPNPFQPIMDEKNSQVSIVVAEGDVVTQDLHLQE